MDDLKALKLERIRDPPRQKNVGINQQDLGRSGDGRVHTTASAFISFSSAPISIFSPPNSNSPLMYFGSNPVSGTRGALASSHSPVTGTAVSSCRDSNLQFAIK